MNEDLTDEELKIRLYAAATEHWKEANRLKDILLKDYKRSRRNEEFYRDLLTECVETHVLFAKVPELVEKLINNRTP